MEPKRQRVDQAKLLQVVHAKGVSGRALTHIINTLTDAEVSRHDVLTASKARFEQVKHQLRFPTTDGGEVAFEVCEPKALLALLLDQNEITRRWFEEAWLAYPSTAATPWKLLVGWDEFTPGNKAALKNSRKMMTLSFSFMELRGRLHHDHAWVTPLAIRSSVIAEVLGGWSAILRGYLRLLLLGPEGLQTSGYPLPIGNTQRLFFAKVDTLLSDGDGLRQALEWNGASAVKPCFRHWNVFDRHSERAAHGPGELYVETTCSDPCKFRSWTGPDLQQAAQVLIEARKRFAAGEIPAARVKTIQRHMATSSLKKAW